MTLCRLYDSMILGLQGLKGFDSFALLRKLLNENREVKTVKTDNRSS